MYTPQQVQGMLELPPSTLRKYAHLFSAHLSDAAHRKQRSYTDGDISVLKQIIKLRSEGVALDGVASRLTVVDVNADTSLAMLPTISERFDGLYKIIADQAQMVQAQQEKIDSLTARLDALESRSLWQRLFPPKRKQE